MALKGPKQSDIMDLNEKQLGCCMTSPFKGTKTTHWFRLKRLEILILEIVVKKMVKTKDLIIKEVERLYPFP